MNLNFRSCRTLMVAALLAVMVVPRCLMASDMIQMPLAKVEQSPCHGMAENTESDITNPISCAQQCEASLVNVFVNKDPAVKWQDQAPAYFAIVTPFSSQVPTRPLHPGWPPDSDRLIVSTSQLYLDTARLRL